MRLFPLLLSLLVFAAPAASAAPSPAPPADAPVLARASDALGFELYAKLPAGNAAISPASISACLALALPGARGPTATEMRAAMHLPAGDPASWTRLEASLEGSDLKLADRLFGERTFAFAAPFLAGSAPLERVDFRGRPEAARGTINAWVSARTGGKIPDLVPADGVNVSTRLALVNAVAFSGTWRTAFDAKDTRDEAFELAPGRTKRVPTMHRTGALRSGTIAGGRAVEIPFAGGRRTMTILVPATSDRLGEVEAQLSADGLAKVDQALAVRDTALALPRFSLQPSGALALGDALKALGMELPFDRAHADFSGLASLAPGERLFLDQVFHAASVRIDEKGAEAAAGTAATVSLDANVASSFDVRADRPFVFLVRDRATGLVLFLGRVADPS